MPKPEITTVQARTAIRALETKIAGLIVDFEGDTGLKIRDIEAVMQQQISDVNPWVYGVRVKVEL